MALIGDLPSDLQEFAQRSLHNDMSDAPLSEAPPDLRARASALERALPHVNYTVTRSCWFVNRRRFSVKHQQRRLTAASRSLNPHHWLLSTSALQNCMHC